MLNLNATETQIQFDEYGLPIEKGDANSIDNCVGTLVCIGLAYGFSPGIITALEQCYVDGQIIRHPTRLIASSRDHHSYFLIYRKYTGQEIPKFKFMCGLYLWMHSLTGNKWAERAYYMIYIPGAYIGNVWLKFCRWIGGIKSELTNKLWIAGGNPNYGTQMLYDRTRWQKLWAWIIFQTIPAYPLHNRGWQLYVMPESKRKERLKRILLKRVGKSNLLLRLLFGDITVTQEEVDAYPCMTGFRPGVYLDETCRRTIRELTEQEAEFNTYEKDLVIYLFEKDDEYYLVI